MSEKEIKQAEWDTIRSIARWFQLDGRMKEEFFPGVQQVKSNPPIQLLIDENGHEYKTNEEISSFTTSYYQDLFTSQGESKKCCQARERC